MLRDSLVLSSLQKGVFPSLVGCSIVVEVTSWEANGWALAEDAELWLVEVLRRSQIRVELGDEAWRQNKLRTRKKIN